MSSWTMCPVVWTMMAGIGDMDFPRIISMPARDAEAVYIPCLHQQNKGEPRIIAVPAAGLAVLKVSSLPVTPITDMG